MRPGLHALLRDGRGLPLVVDLISGRKLEIVLVRFPGRELYDGESLFTKERAGTRRQEIDRKLVGMPVLTEAGKRDIVTHHTSVRHLGLANASSLYSQNALSS